MYLHSCCLLWHQHLYLASPSGYIYQYNKHDVWNLCEQYFTIVSAPLHSISTGPTLSIKIVGVSFQFIGTEKYATPAGLLFVHFILLGVSNKFSHSEINESWILLNRAQQSVHFSSFLENLTWATFKKQAAKWPLCILLKSCWHILPYILQVTL